MSGSGKGFRSTVPAQAICGPRCVLHPDDERFPEQLKSIPHPPKALFVVGDPAALEMGLAVVGARKATPYGIGCAKRFAAAAANRGICIISGGARGCDAAAHEAALEAGAKTVVFLGGGCDKPYPAEHAALFERVANSGGAVVSEHPWDAPPLPQRFRLRNRLIAGLARAVLIVEAGLPSGTFSTADEALGAGRDVLVVPGAITSPYSRGANRLLYQGATPVVDDDSFDDALFSLFGCLKQETYRRKDAQRKARPAAPNPIAAALSAQPMGTEELYELARLSCKAGNPRSWLMRCLAEGEQAGLFARYPDGRYGPCAGVC